MVAKVSQKDILTSLNGRSHISRFPNIQMTPLRRNYEWTVLQDFDSPTKVDEIYWYSLVTIESRDSIKESILVIGGLRLLSVKGWYVENSKAVNKYND